MSRTWPKDADHVSAAPQRDGADFARYSLAVSADRDNLVVGALRWSHEVASEYLLRTARLLWRDDRGQVAAPNVSHDPLGGGVQPADDPVRIDDVSGNPDTLDGIFDVAADPLELGHGFDSAPRGARNANSLRDVSSKPTGDRLTNRRPRRRAP